MTDPDSTRAQYNISPPRPPRPFSYQLPYDEHDPNREETPTPHASQEPARQSQRVPTQTLEIPYDEAAWAGFPQRRYSLAETPIDDNTQDFGEGTQPSIIARQHEERDQRLAQQQELQQEQQQHYRHPPLPPQAQASIREQQNSHQQSQPQAFSTEKREPARMPSAYQLPPPSEPHPANFAPYAEGNTSHRATTPSSQIPANRHSSATAATNTTVATTPTTVATAVTASSDPPNSPGKPPQEGDVPKQPRSPHPPPEAYAPKFSPPPTHPANFAANATAPGDVASGAPPFSPYAPQSPDLDTHHRPGQAVHPSMLVRVESGKKTKRKSHKSPGAGGAPAATAAATGPAGRASTPAPPPEGKPPFLHGLFSCSDVPTCTLGLVCPCILYARLLHRLNNISLKRSPTDLLSFSKCNGHCLLFTSLCVCGGFPAGLLSGVASSRVRGLYGVQGNLARDACKGVFCCCCVLVQGEREVVEQEREREREMGRSADLEIAAATAAVPGSMVGGEGYEAREGMRYAPPGR